jgi:glutamate-ammonia-ligase adenylyltransferase
VNQALVDAYEFLRSVEHRLQIVLAGQTHSIPKRDAELEITARRMGFERAERLLGELQAHRDRVHAMYANLLDQKTDAAEYEGRQFFRLLSGELSDEEAIAHLRRYRLRDAAAALPLVRALDQVPTLAHSRSSLRNLVANLLTVMMVDLERTVEPERVLNRFERVVTGAGAAAALFRSLLENDELREAFITVLDGGDFFAERLARHPEALDFLASPTLDRAVLSTTFPTALAPLGAAGAERRRDELRRLKTLDELKVLIEWLHQGDLGQLQDKLSLIADCVVQQVTAWEQASAGDSWAVFALGKLGGRELSVHSDLDLVFLYRGEPHDAETFARYQGFVQRVHEVLETPTAEGIVYRLDTRLRPEGRKGALASPLVAFKRYLRTRAEIWERLAWTRCRFLAGDAGLAADAARAVTAFVYGAWSPEIPAYVDRVRTRMERELAREDGSRLDFKVGTGGLTDIDFVLQLVQIREGHRRAELRQSGTGQVLAAALSSEFLPRHELASLANAHEFLRTLETVVRLAADASVGWFSTEPGQLDLIGSRLGLPPPAGEHLLRRYREVTGEVRGIYKRVLRRLEGE